MVATSSKTLFLRNVPSELVREAKAAAARRGITLTSIVCEALAGSLGVEGDTQNRDDELQGDILWYRQNQPKLVRLYRDEYVAIVDAAVVDHGRDFNALAIRVWVRLFHIGARREQKRSLDKPQPRSTWRQRVGHYVVGVA